MTLLNKTIENIKPIDEELLVSARAHWDSLVHPTGSLGELEEIGIRMTAIRGSIPKRFDKRAVVVMCSDNGIMDENVSSSPKPLTKSLALAMNMGKTGLCALCKDANSDVIIVDMGIENFEGQEGIIDKRISNCSRNFMKEPAMTREEAIRAIESGIEVAEELINKGYEILGTGELGMGNTTTSAAVISAILNLPAKDTVGLGSGVDDVQFSNKLRVVDDGIRLHKPNPEDSIDVISKVGGYDIAGLTGVFLACASHGVPVVIDGIISAAAALSASKLSQESTNYMFGSHIPKERGASYALKEIGVKAYLDLALRLGEGSGCPIMFKVIDSAIFAMNNMTKFSDTDIQNVLVNIRDK